MTCKVSADMYYKAGESILNDLATQVGFILARVFSKTVEEVCLV